MGTPQVIAEPTDCIGYYQGVGPHREELVQLRDGTTATLRVSRAPPATKARPQLPDVPTPRPHRFLAPPPPPPRPTCLEFPLALLSGRSPFEGAGHDVKVEHLAESHRRQRAGIPPIVLELNEDGSVFSISDGFHRIAAGKLLGHTHILARTRKA